MKFAELNDDVLFGEVWSREDKLSLRDRSLVTVTSLMSQGLIDSAFRYHLESAKKNGITKEEITEILTHNAFYAGWPKAWVAFRMAKEVWNEKNEKTEDNTIEKHASSMIFPIGEPNDNFARWLEVKNKEFYYITTMADNEKSSADTTLACFRGYANCVEGAVEKGDVVAGGVYEKDEIKNHPAMKLAYQMGKNV
ncbi:carboxymuconolactone decarboxylase family protein [uncultured Eubacterium sp.]|uniref:carboxymuconolactone decarboxylase family protein n=1 Tax=uncultured Eubacterium sp. TaxID=165185 RepID=UPI00338FA775